MDTLKKWKDVKDTTVVAFCCFRSSPARLRLLGCPASRIERGDMTDRFPAPWRIVEIPSGFAVEDATERQLGVFYGRADPKHGGPHRLSDDGRGEADCSRLLGPDGLSRFD